MSESMSVCNTGAGRHAHKRAFPAEFRKEDRRLTLIQLRGDTDGWRAD